MAVADMPKTSSANASRSLPPRMRKLLLTPHISTAAGLVGADLVLLVLGINGAQGAVSLI